MKFVHFQALLASLGQLARLLYLIELLLLGLLLVSRVVVIVVLLDVEGLVTLVVGWLFVGDGALPGRLLH